MSTMRVNFMQFGLLVCFVSIPQLSLWAQTPGTTGWNGVEFSTGSNTAASYALVDATQFGGSDLCQMISNTFAVFNSTTAGGIVIDARGVSGTNCTSGVNPWDSLLASGATTAFSNIVLLPAGTIQISRTWVLPNSTRLVGEGPQITTISWTGGSNYPDMIDMGYEGSTLTPPVCSNNSAPDCPSIVIEHLGLSGGGSGVNGIVNCCSQERAQVRDVLITNLTGTGLEISDKYAQNSGPYSDITITSASKCLAIGPGANFPIPNTRLIQGLKCSATGSAAITIDGSNNRLEDISISGSSTDGILIGSVGPAPNNTLFNVKGSGFTNVVRISSQSHTQTSTTGCPYFGASASDDVCDLTISGVTRSSGGTYTIKDELTGANITDSNVAIYILGERVLNTSGGHPNSVGYSRYTTAIASGNANAPAWLVGSSTPDQGSSCSVGSFYSCTGSCSGGTLWECRNNSTPWKAIQ